MPCGASAVWAGHPLTCGHKPCTSTRSACCPISSPTSTRACCAAWPACVRGRLRCDFPVCLSMMTHVLCVCVCACAYLHFPSLHITHLPQAWIDRLCLSTQPHLPSFTATELSWLLMALASLGARPPRTWMAHFSNASQALVEDFSPLVRLLCLIIDGWLIFVLLPAQACCVMLEA